MKNHKKINEKFVEKSDPIRDLGIGLVNIMAKIDELKKEDGAHIRIKSYLEKFLNKEISGKFTKFLYKETLKYYRFIPKTYDTYFDHDVVTFTDEFSMTYRVLRDEKYLTSAMMERFEEKSDPIKDMEIGVFKKHKFSSPDEAAEYVYSILPYILGTNEIPQKIIRPVSYRYLNNVKKTFRHPYGKKILDFVEKYINKINDKSVFFYANIRNTLFVDATMEKLYDILFVNGYGYDKEDKVAEGFVQNSDPIKDMNIGYDKDAEYNFANNPEFFQWFINFLPAILETDKIPEDILKDPQYDINPLYFDKIRIRLRKIKINNQRFNYFDFENKPFTIYLRDYLKNRGYKMNEAFSEKSDPIKDLKIGIHRNFNTNREMLDQLIQDIPYILNTKDIPKDIINEYMLYIRLKYWEKISKYVNNFYNLELTPSELHQKLRELGFKTQ